MNTLKFGVFNTNFTRTYLTAVLNTVYHYDGQLVISDGSASNVVDPYFMKDEKISVLSFKQASMMKASLKETHQEWKDLLTSDPSADMLHFSLEDIFFFENKATYPITWFATYDEAISASKPMPEKRQIAKSEPIPANYTQQQNII
jgi:hypothetical protein